VRADRRHLIAYASQLATIRRAPAGRQGQPNDHSMTISGDELLKSRLRLPEHVVHRNFVAETVVLNLQTGMYHGLNPTAGRMLDRLDTSSSVGEAASAIAGEFGEDRCTVEADLLVFCRDLLERKLVEVVDDGRH
jgi:Coenzyme PQQ synthesis protein D (PqqD)